VVLCTSVPCCVPPIGLHAVGLPCVFLYVLLGASQWVGHVCCVPFLEQSSGWANVCCVLCAVCCVLCAVFTRASRVYQTLSFSECSAHARTRR
jgi:hypothetical protein